MTEERIFSVYIHKFPNGKQYVGITRTTPQQRWSNGNGYNHNLPMNKDIKTYGWDNIEHILFNDEGILYTEEEACYIENNLINSWNLMNERKGYNLRTGGVNSYTLHKSTIKKLRKKKTKPVVQYDLDGKKVAEFFSGKEAERQTKINNANISKCCNGIVLRAGNYMWRLKEDNLETISPLKYDLINNKPVVQYDLDGKKVAEYNSVREAGRILNINPQNISYCCLGKILTIGNSQWKHKLENLEEINPVKYYKGKPIIQYDLNGKKVAEFNSAKEAGVLLNICPSSITKCCKGKNKTAGNYKWDYKKKMTEILGEE